MVRRFMPRERLSSPTSSLSEDVHASDDTSVSVRGVPAERRLLRLTCDDGKIVLEAPTEGRPRDEKGEDPRAVGDSDFS
jgi:hypothetical protein